MTVQSFSQADILLTQRKKLEQPLFLLIWIATATFSLSELGGVNLFYLTASTVAVFANTLAIRQNKELFLNRRFVNIGLFLSVLLVIFESITIEDQIMLITVGHLMVLLILCKMFERKKPRDHAQLIVLSVLLMLINSLINWVIWFPLVMMIFVGLAMYVAMIFTISRGIAEIADQSLSQETGPLSPRRVAWNVTRKWPAKVLRRFVWYILIPASLIGIGAFIFTPRFADNMIQFLGKDSAGMQLSDSIQLGGADKLYLSNKLVMKVKVFSNDKPGEVKNDAAKYLRSRLMTVYSFSAWKSADVVGKQYRSARGLRVPENTNATRYQIDTQLTDGTSIPAPYATCQINLSRPVPEHTADMLYRLRPSMSLINSGFVKRINYDVKVLLPPFDESQVMYLRQIRSRFSVNLARSVVLLPPDTDVKVLALARKWCKDLLEKRANLPAERRAEMNVKIAQRLALRLRTEYKYSLDLTDSDPDRDGVEDFLFHMKRGHCEYFASSLAVMCNRLNVPARVATGFVLNEYDSDSNEYLVRGRDAHAWCEVYSPQTDWIIVDATPGSERVEAMTDDSIWGKISEYWQELSFLWNQNVVGYDHTNQAEISKKVSQSALSWTGKVKNWFMSVWNGLKNLVSIGSFDDVLYDFIFLLAGLLAGLLGVWKLFAIRARMNRSESYEVKCQLLWMQKLIDLLTTQGFEVSPCKTLVEQFENACKEYKMPAEPVENLVRLQYQWRWGGVRPTESEMKTARADFNTLSEHIHHLAVQAKHESAKKSVK